jgi:hypothetical protein
MYSESDSDDSSDDVCWDHHMYSESDSDDSSDDVCWDHHMYSECDSDDSSDDVCWDLQNWCYCFYQYYHNVFDITLFIIFSIGVSLLRVRFMVFNDTINNISVISWRSVLLVEETRVHGANHRPVVNHWQSLSHNVVSSTPRHERGSNSQR